MEIAMATYRLLFKEPFGTAHGLRTGTDSVFVKLVRGGSVGYGEATMPPYVTETQQSVVQWITLIGSKQIHKVLDALSSDGKVLGSLTGPPAARSALVSACYDLISKELRIPVEELLQVEPRIEMAHAKPMITLGHGPLENLTERVAALDASFPILKIKLGTEQDRILIQRVLERDARPLLLDVNQGWTSVDDALRVLEDLPTGRIIGLEQPFPKDRLDLHRELLERVPGSVVLADESIQDPADMEVAAGAFNAVNIKLMKCGGLDRAQEMIRKARSLGWNVMLGSMSESTLGCATMSKLTREADLADLDGPWLIANDPFTGWTFEGGQPLYANVYGIGVSERLGVQLNWIPTGA